MKTIKIIYTFILATLLSACGDDFLDLAPPSNANAETFYKSAADFNVGVMAAYAVLQGSDQYGSNLTTFIGYRSDNLEVGSTASARHFIDAFTESVSNEELDETWESMYNGIFRCNIILDKIDEVDFDETLKNQYKGEVRFLRALHYFNAVRIWGAVPLIIEVLAPSESLTIGRSSVSEVYQSIQDDLEFAALNLPVVYSGQDIGRATFGAAKTLLGKVYLTQQKWAEANSVLGEVVASSQYDLLADIKDVFDTNNKDNKEMVFFVKYLKGTDESHGLWFSNPAGGSTNLTPDLYAAYEDTDLRSELLERVPSGNFEVPLKYFDELSSTLDAGNDYPVLRYADVFLMKAEALNEIGYTPDGEAFTLLNEVRTRAGLAGYTSANLSDQQAFRDAIQNERRLELALENHRWFDLIRTGTAISVMNSKTQFNGNLFDVKEHQLIYPVPNSEVLRFNDESLFWQNPGY